MRTALLAILALGCTNDQDFKPDDPESTGSTGPTCTEVAWYYDGDADFVGAGFPTYGCEPPADGWVEVDGDCDPYDQTVFPGATERCNGADDDCDKLIDEDVGDTYYTDADGDLFGDPDAPVVACEPAPGLVEDDGDCDDANAAVNPDGIELCNGVDDDCNGLIDDEPENPSLWWRDADGDTWGDPEDEVEACEPPPGYVANDEDCDDADAKNWDACAGDPDSVGVCLSGYPLSTAYFAATEPELHLIGVYEPDRAVGTIDVAVDRPGSEVVLVLSSYEPVDWVLSVTPTTNLKEVVLNGYNTHTVAGMPKGTVLTRRDGIGLYWDACGYELPSSGGGCDTEDIVAGAEAYTGLPLNSFTGCYVASSFSLIPGP
jgi:hypothetical protein